MALKPRGDRRERPLSTEQIIAAAIEILDTDGDGALTFRALAGRLRTGSGAIYGHIADKDELLAASADRIVSRAMDAVARRDDPSDLIRAISIAMFDAVAAHRWVGGLLNREPWRPGMLQVYEGLGRGIVALGVPEPALFDAWSALLNYILGVAAQNAANARILGRPERSDFLDDVATRWENADPAEHPFVRRLAARLRGHDDREQYLAGIDLILTGIEALSRRTA